MALFKTDLGVAAGYLRLVDPDLRDRLWDQIAGEHARVAARILEITGEPRLLAATPALFERLSHRNPWVDPLSHLQVELLRARAPGPSTTARRCSRRSPGSPRACATPAERAFTSCPRPRRLGRMADHDLDRHRDERPRRAEARAPEVVPVHPLLALQQTAGNQAVQRLIAGLGGKDVLPEAVADPEEQAAGGRDGDVVERRDSARALLRNGDAPAAAGTAPNLSKRPSAGRPRRSTASSSGSSSGSSTSPRPRAA